MCDINLTVGLVCDLSKLNCQRCDINLTKFCVPEVMVNLAPKVLFSLKKSRRLLSEVWY